MRDAKLEPLVKAEFQSTPDREAGRCHPDQSLGDRSSRFNPRPTVRPGDARDS